MAGKYPGRNGKLLLRACHHLFDALPLCALIQASEMGKADGWVGGGGGSVVLHFGGRI